MDILSEKIELAKKLLDTEDKSILDAIRSIFDHYDIEEDWGDLPDKAIADVKDSIKQIELGQSIPHDKARASFKRWL